MDLAANEKDVHADFYNGKLIEIIWLLLTKNLQIFQILMIYSMRTMKHKLSYKVNSFILFNKG
jgi:hypothetical protein